MQALRPVLLAGLGGFIGSVGRYLIGVLGGSTTFSSFAYETLALTRDAEFSRAMVNSAAQLILGLAAVWLGYAWVRA